MKAFAGALAVLVLLSAGPSTAQFKHQAAEQGRVGEAVVEQSLPSSLFGWFDMNRFQMTHSFSMSYSTFGGQGMSLGMYTNTMRYHFAENLNVRADVSFMFSPYNTMSKFGSNSITGVYLTNAQVNYRPWENFAVQISYRQVPYGGYYDYRYNPFYDPFLARPFSRYEDQ